MCSSDLVWLVACGGLAANAQVPGLQMPSFGGPFAGMAGANGLRMTPLYGSQAGALPHIWQATNALVMPDGGAGVASMQMAASNQGPAPDGTTRERSEAPDVNVSERPLDVFIGACAGGAFIGGFSAFTATVPAGAAPIAAPAMAYAGAIGCGLGVTTAVVSVGVVYIWRRLTR